MKESHDKPRLEGRFEWFQDKAIDIRAKFDKAAVHDDRICSSASSRSART
jgi:hypothetical protein